MGSCPVQSPPVAGRRYVRRGALLAIAGLTSLLLAGALTILTPANAAPASVPLGTAKPFAILAGSTVTNTGPSVINGELGLSPGTSVTGFPPGIVNAPQHIADAVALKAKADLVVAYNNAAGRPATELAATELGGRTLGAGVYHNPTLGITGTVTLDGAGDPSSVWIFQADSTLITGSGTGARVALINGADPCNVFWKVGSSATLGTTTTFVGTIMALTSISLQNGTTVLGRALARNGAVTLINNVFNLPTCAAPPTTTITTTTATNTTGTTTTGTTTTTTGTTTTGTSTGTTGTSTGTTGTSTGTTGTSTGTTGTSTGTTGTSTGTTGTSTGTTGTSTGTTGTSTGTTGTSTGTTGTSTGTTGTSTGTTGTSTGTTGTGTGTTGTGTGTTATGTGTTATGTTGTTRRTTTAVGGGGGRGTGSGGQLAFTGLSPLIGPLMIGGGLSLLAGGLILAFGPTRAPSRRPRHAA